MTCPTAQTALRASRWSKVLGPARSAAKRSRSSRSRLARTKPPHSSAATVSVRAAPSDPRAPSIAVPVRWSPATGHAQTVGRRSLNFPSSRAQTVRYVAVTATATPVLLNRTGVGKLSHTNIVTHTLLGTPRSVLLTDIDTQCTTYQGI